MHLKPLICTVLACALYPAGAAWAQGDGRRNDRGHEQTMPHGPSQHSAGSDEHAGRDAQERSRGAGPEQHWRKGDRLSAEYRSKQYVVDDWRGHHLSAPPRGYHWVQLGGDYVLVAITTGIILQLLLSP